MKKIKKRKFAGINEQSKDRIYRVIVLASALVVLVLAFYLVTESISRYTGFVIAGPDDESLNACLKEKNIKLFIEEADPYNYLKSLDTYEVMNNIEITNCYKNPFYCEDMSIMDYPAYIIQNEIIYKDMKMEEFIQKTGCLSD